MKLLKWGTAFLAALLLVGTTHGQRQRENPVDVQTQPAIASSRRQNFLEASRSARRQQPQQQQQGQQLTGQEHQQLDRSFDPHNPQRVDDLDQYYGQLGEQLHKTIKLMSQTFDHIYNQTLAFFEEANISLNESQDGIQYYEIDFPLPNVNKEDVEIYLDDESIPNTVILKVIAEKNTHAQSGAQSEIHPPPPGRMDLSGANWVQREGDKPFWERFIRRRRRQEQTRRSPSQTQDDNVAPQNAPIIQEQETLQEDIQQRGQPPAPSQRARRH